MSYLPTTKRLLDIIVSLTLAIIFLPIWLIVPLLIVLTSQANHLPA